jgi:hypothetical protein
MKAKELKNISDNLVGVAALYLCFTEVSFPWSIATALLGFMFCTWSAMAWQATLHPTKSTLESGVIAHLITVSSHIVLSVIPFVLIVLVPGPTPDGVLGIASTYAFIKAIVFSRQ